MKFEKIELEFSKYETLDIIAESFENVTDPTTPVEPTTNYDPYEFDKF